MDTSDKPPSPKRREVLEWEAALPPHIRPMWEEICEALEHKLFTLVPQGARTLVDRVARDLVGPTNSFAQSVELLAREGFISRRDKDRLKVVVEAGNAAAHRDLDLKEEEQARVLVHAIENLLRGAYFPQEAVDSIRTATPPRPQTRKR
jgi:uncharacterized protein YutE (UPF0331/DUF86 family)